MKNYDKLNYFCRQASSTQFMTFVVVFRHKLRPWEVCDRPVLIVARKAVVFGFRAYNPYRSAFRCRNLVLLLCLQEN